MGLPRYHADKLSISLLSLASSVSSLGLLLSPRGTPKPRRQARNMKNLSLNLKPQLASPGTVVTALGNVYKNKLPLLDDNEDGLLTPSVVTTPVAPPAIINHINHSNDSLTLYQRRVGIAPTPQKFKFPQEPLPATQLRSPLVFATGSDIDSSSSINVLPLRTTPVATPPADIRYSMVSLEPTQLIFSDHFDKHQLMLTDHRLVFGEPPHKPRDDALLVSDKLTKSHERDDLMEGDDYRNKHHAPKRHLYKGNPPSQPPPPHPQHPILLQMDVSLRPPRVVTQVAHYPVTYDDMDVDSDTPPAVPEKTNEELLRLRTVHKKQQTKLQHQRSQAQLRKNTDKEYTLDHLATIAKKLHPMLDFEKPKAAQPSSDRRRRVRLSPQELNAKALPPLPGEVASAVTTPELQLTGTITTTLLTPNSAPLTSSNTTVTYVPYSKLPEELQEQNLLNAYSDGPQNVLNGKIFLYLDPQLSPIKVDINEYDLVINVAKECPDLSAQYRARPGAEYMYVPWQHTTNISTELPAITEKIREYFDKGLKILVHCQCGVLRLACVIVAFFMLKFNLGVNQAYDLLKQGTDGVTNDVVVQAVTDKGNYIGACDRICPNMSLIFELMEFGDYLKS